MSLPEIYADYHDVDDENRVFLTKMGTRRDLAALGIELHEGMKITIYMDDADDDGNPDDLMADAIVHYNRKKKSWVAQIDWSRVQNRSEREEVLAPKTSPGPKNGAVAKSMTPVSVESQDRKPRRTVKKA